MYVTDNKEINMVGLVQVALASGMVAASVAFLKKSSSPLLVQTLSTVPALRPPAASVVAIVHPLTGADAPYQQIFMRWRALQSQLLTIDACYHAWIHRHVDPLFGRQRHEQALAFRGERPYEPQAAEKNANYQIALSVCAMACIGIAAVTSLPLTPLAIGIGLYLSWPIYELGYYMAVRERRFSIAHINIVYNLVMWLGGYYLIGVFVSVLMGIVNKISVLSENDVRSQLIDIFGQQPRQIWALVDGSEVEIPFEQVRIGDLLVLDVGQMVPVDGRIVQGLATIDQHMLTGEAQPAEKGIGEQVLASTIVLSGRIYIQVEKTGAETTAAQIGEILNRTAQQNLTMLYRAMKITDRSLIPMVAAGLLSLPLVGTTGAIALLGCNFMPIMMALAPLTLLNALNQCSHHGVLVKDGEALEKLYTIDTIVFDKTGTLTLEQPHVRQIHPCAGLDEERVLTLAAAAEHRQSHPVAQAILLAAAERDLVIPRIADAHYEIGYGIKVRTPLDLSDNVAESTLAPAHPTALIRVGSQRFMTMESIPIPTAIQQLATTCQDQGHSLVYVAVDESLVGVIELKATVRPEAHRVIQQLHQRGLQLYIISGDHEAPTRTLATELGMDGYFANTLPERKAGLVEGLQKEGRQVCFIGDGINDAIALRQANVSISLRGATTAATDTAQMILMNADLSQLLTLLQLADGLHNSIDLNLKVATVSSFLAGGGVLFLGLKFVIVETVFALNFFTGVQIACKPLLPTPPRS